MNQQTLKTKTEFKGVGIHSGKEVVMTINPAAENTGIMFRRIDLEGSQPVKALYSNVVDTRNNTSVGDGKGTVVSTIEHIMSALYMAGIDNALVDLSSVEIPMMDGGSRQFYEGLKKAGLQTQSAACKYLKIKKEVDFQDDKGNRLSISPNDGLKIDFTIEFPSKIVGTQNFSKTITEEIFAEEISPSRTFTEKALVEQIWAMGLGKGGNLYNTVVLDGETILNPEGFRVKNECVNHKVLDAIGDLYTSGYRVLGELKAYRTGHFHTNELLKKVFADKLNYEIIG